MIKLSMIQMSSTMDNLEANESKIMNYIHKSIDLKASIICFPEMALIGYGFDDLDNRLKKQSQMIKKIHEIAILNDVMILVGGLKLTNESLYITQYVIHKNIETYDKVHVGQKELKYCASGNDIPVFSYKAIKFGIMICYDGHFPELSGVMARKGADLIFNPSASPNNPEKRVLNWCKYLTARAYDNRVWVLATNLRFNEKGGGILVINSDGDCVLSCSKDEDHMAVFDYVKKEYSETSMKNRDFKVNRRPEVYNS